ncbi:pirin family protein [Dechloromonas sp. XY25]|uniref:Pirin family protein n=1 Tax=Dechloromonas hankyongensis TaxID=2908002 RepID=A0ABS9JZ60_9RHOO|nr:pirin family protein [Dechloromonas hankyongensis]MCG2576193.1 pirin family protein [Dechloromonas hankyongensis]
MSAIVRIEPRSADLGNGMLVRRTLPSRQQRMIGAWCFLDHAGPVVFPAGQGMHVGAHPHIGLQTFTWLIEGEVLHRDSLGNEQIIRPGQVNLMTAGRGIAHTEDSLHDGRRLHAAQLWIALPPEAENCPPAFAHHPDLPQWQQGGARLTLLAGTYARWTAPAHVHSPLLGLDISSDGPASVDLSLDPAFEYGLLPLVGEASIEDERFQADEFAYLGDGRSSLQLDLTAGTQILLLGGLPFAQPVLMWWNFVGWSKAGIAEAQRQWENGDPRFGTIGDGSAPRLSPPPLPWRD